MIHAIACSDMDLNILVYCAFQSIRTTDNTVTIFIRVLLPLLRIIDLKSR